MLSSFLFALVLHIQTHLKLLIEWFSSLQKNIMKPYFYLTPTSIIIIRMIIERGVSTPKIMMEQLYIHTPPIFNNNLNPNMWQFPKIDFVKLTFFGDFVNNIWIRFDYTLCMINKKYSECFATFHQKSLVFPIAIWMLFFEKLTNLNFFAKCHLYWKKFFYTTYQVLKHIYRIC